MVQDGTAGDVVEWDIHRQELFRVWRINRGLTRHFMLRMRLSVSIAERCLVKLVCQHFRNGQPLGSGDDSDNRTRMMQEQGTGGQNRA